MKGINRKSKTCRLCKHQAKQQLNVLPTSHAIHKLALATGDITVETGKIFKVIGDLYCCKLTMQKNSILQLSGNKMFIYDTFKTMGATKIFYNSEL